MQPFWLRALMWSADRSQPKARVLSSRGTSRVFRSTVSTVSHQRL